MKSKCLIMFLLGVIATLSVLLVMGNGVSGNLTTKEILNRVLASDGSLCIAHSEKNALNVVFDPTINALRVSMAGGTLAEYLAAAKKVDQTNFSTNDTLVFDTLWTSSGSSISLNTSNGVFTLATGKTYMLTSGMRYEHTAASRIGFAWYNETTSSEISIRTRLMNMSEAGDYSTLPIAKTIITPTVETNVTVRCVWEGDGVEDINAGHAWAIIEVM